LSVGGNNLCETEPKGHAVAFQVEILLKVLREFSPNADFDASSENLVEQLGITGQQTRFINVGLKSWCPAYSEKCKSLIKINGGKVSQKVNVVEMCCMCPKVANRATFT